MIDLLEFLITLSVLLVSFSLVGLIAHFNCLKRRKEILQYFVLGCVSLTPELSTGFSALICEFL